MGTTSQKIQYLGETKSLLKDSINSLGGNITSQTTFRQYATELDSIYSRLPKVSGTGSILSLSPTLKGRLGIVPKGDTYQFTTTGKNLCKPIATTTKNGMTFTNNGDGSYTLNGTTTANSSFYIIGLNYSAGTYSLSANNTTTNSNGAFYIQAEYSGGSIRTSFFITNATITAATTNPITAWSVVVPTGLSLTNFKIQPQLESGNSATDFEPYTGGTASPNPDYPQEIKSVTGLQKVTISGGTGTTPQEYEINLGKNLFDKNSTTLGRIDTSGVVATISGYYTSDFIKVEPNTTYTKNSPTSDAYHRFAFYSSNDTSTFISTSNNNTIIIPSNCNYLRFCGIDTEVNTAQLEKGSEATPYSPYFTPIKLKKSQDGTYSDYIQGLPNNWSIKRQIGSVVLDGTNYKCTYMFNNGSFYVYDTVNSQTIRNCVKSDNNLGILSNYLISNTYTNVFTNGVVGICSNNTLGELCVNLGITTSKDDINNWLSTHNTIIDYPLATETTEPITNTELIEDLNNFYNNAKSYNGQTNISVEGDLQMILDVSAIIGD